MSNNEILLSLQAALTDLRVQQAMLQYELERLHARMMMYQMTLENIDHAELYAVAWDFAETGEIPVQQMYERLLALEDKKKLEILAALDAGHQHLDIINDSLEENARDISNTLSAIQYIEKEIVDEINMQERDAFDENYDANIWADISECIAAERDW